MDESSDILKKHESESYKEPLMIRFHLHEKSRIGKSTERGQEEVDELLPEGG